MAHGSHRHGRALGDAVERLASDAVLADAVDVADGLDRIPRYVLAVRRQPFGVFGRAVDTIVKTQIIAMGVMCGSEYAPSMTLQVLRSCTSQHESSSLMSASRSAGLALGSRQNH